MKTLMPRRCPNCSAVPVITQGDCEWRPTCCEFSRTIRPQKNEHAARHEWQFRVGHYLNSLQPRRYLPSEQTLRYKANLKKREEVA